MMIGSNERKTDVKMLNNLKIVDLFSILDNSRDAFFILNSAGVIIFWSKSAEKITGLSPEDTLDKRLSSTLLDESYRVEFDEAIASWADSGDNSLLNQTLELFALRSDKTNFPAELSIREIISGGDKYLACYLRDVSEKITNYDEMNKLIEELHVTKDLTEQQASDFVYLNARLTESEEKLQELNASKDRFFSIIAHDLKGPFQGLLGYSELLSRDIDMLSQEDIKDFAESLNNSAKQLFKLLENLLQWSRIQRGVIEYNPNDFQIKMIADMNLSLIEGRARQKGIKLENDISSDVYCYADENMTNTVIRNLMSNAVKFTRKGQAIGIRSSEINDNFVTIEVYDTGIGMSKEAQEKLFRIDQAYTTPGTDNEQGTGLGLILCKELIEKNKGSIRVSSEEGKGTSFFLRIPKGKPDNY